MSTVLSQSPVAHPAVLLPEGSFVMLPVADLLKMRHPSNNNVHPAGQIKAYIKILRAGIRQPVVVSRQSGLILKGHGALESALKAGWTHYPVQYQDFPDGEPQELAFLLADNQLASLAKTDKTATAGILEKLRANQGFDLALTGFSKPKVDSLLAKLKEKAEDPAPPVVLASLKLIIDPRWAAAAAAAGVEPLAWITAALDAAAAKAG